MQDHSVSLCNFDKILRFTDIEAKKSPLKVGIVCV